MSIHGYLNDCYQQLIGSLREYVSILKTTPLNEILLASRTCESGPMTNWFRKYNSITGAFDGEWVLSKEHFGLLYPAQAARLIQVFL
jgi:hypothetical protein